MRLPKVREIGEALRSLFSRAYTGKYFPVPEGFRGTPYYHEDDCVGCLACLEVCPARAIDYADDKTKKLRTLTHHLELCINCQQCERACITEKGIILSKDYDTSTYDRASGVSQSTKALVICEECGEAVGCVDHVKYLARKLGPLAFTNPTLLQARHDELNALEKETPSDSSHRRAAIHLKITCPACRRAALLREQW